MQLSKEEIEDWAIERVSAGVWNGLTRETQLELIERCIWKLNVYEEWLQELEAEESRRRPSGYKQYKRYMKKNA